MKYQVPKELKRKREDKKISRKNKKKQNETTMRVIEKEGTITSININGLKQQKLAILENYILEKKPEVIMIQETHIRAEELTYDMKIEGYSHGVTEREEGQKKGGGLLMYWKENIQADMWKPEGKHIENEVNKERMWLLTEGPERLAIANIYMCTQSKKRNEHTYVQWNTKIYNMIRTEIEIFKEQGFNIILIGDFNGHLGQMGGQLQQNNPLTNINGRLAIAFIREQNLQLLNSYEQTGKIFTRKEEAKGDRKEALSCLDLALVDQNIDTDGWTFTIKDPEQTLINSDHSMIEVAMKNTYIQKENITTKSNRPKYNLTHETDYTEYKEAIRILNKRNPQRIFNRQSIEAQSLYLHKIIKEAGKKLEKQPKTTNPGARRRIKQHTRKLIKERDTIWETIKTGRATINEINIHKELSKEIKRQIAETISETRNKQRYQLTMRDPTRAKFWKLMKRVPNNKKDISALKNEKGVIVFETQELGDIIYKSFTKRLNGSTTKKSKKKQKRMFQDKYGKKLTKEVTKEEFNSIINKVKNNKAAGPFGIKAEFIKYGGDNLHRYIILWLNKMLTNGKVPATLKAGRVKLIYKRGSSFDPLNYRPITLSSVLLKILTRILNTRLTNLLEDQNLLSDKQYGFRKNKSTQDAIFIVTTAIEQAKKEKDNAAIAFVDLKAAYDKVTNKYKIPHKHNNQLKINKKIKIKNNKKLTIY